MNSKCLKTVVLCLVLLLSFWCLNLDVAYTKESKEVESISLSRSVTNAYDLIHAFAILVSGVALIMPYKLISKIAENIDKFGNDNDGKRIAKIIMLLRK